MGKSSGSAKQDVTEYRMSIHIGVGLELDSVNALWVDDKYVWRGSIHENAAVQINQPELFGGQKKEGGLVGTMQVLLGRPNQVLPPQVAARYGKSPQNCVAFRGVTTIMFHGNSVVSTGRPGEWDDFGSAWNGGQSAYNSGFLWRMNSPIIGQKIVVEGTRAPKGLGNLADALIGQDANPVHIIYECLTNREWGMSGAVELIDVAQFVAEGVRIKGEGLGLSMWWMRQSTIEAFITEILDHIQATLFVNPNTGLLSIKLLRDDYDVADLRHITPENAVLTNFKRRSSGEIVNELTVTWTNPENGKEESITAQDIASIASQNGEKVSGSRNYYGVRNAKLATELLSRDLRASTAPLVSADAKLDRSAWDVLPGEVMLLSWPKRGLNSIVVRAGKVNYGKPLDSSIKISVLQDIFSLARPPIKIMPPSDWVDTRVDPSPLDMRLFAVPSYFVRNAEIQNAAIAVGEDEALVGVLADSATADSLDYELVSESVAADGSAVITSKGTMSLTPLGHLSSALPAAATSVLPADLFPALNEAPRKGGFAFIGYADANQEIALVTGRNANGWTIARGVLDTVPKSWAIGTPVWSVNPGARIVDTQTIHAAGETVAYRGLDRTALGILAYGAAPVVTATLTNRADLPLRPANVQVNGVAFGSFAIGGASAVTITWATRNRLMEDNQVLNWTDGPIAPEYRQETVVQVYNVATGDLIREYPSIWTDTSLSFPKAAFDRYAAVRFVVLSRRDDLDSLTGHAVTVTGFAANVSAPLPPEPAVRTAPPSPITAPAEFAFTVVEGGIIDPDGVEVPAIVVAGRQDRADATHLVIRYQAIFPADPSVPGSLSSVGAMETSASLVLNREAGRYYVAGVLGATKYAVSVAYVVADILGQFRHIGDIVTLTLIAGDVVPTAPALRPLLDGLGRVPGLLEDQWKNAINILEEVISRREIDRTDREAAIKRDDVIGNDLVRTKETLEVAVNGTVALIDTERQARITAISAEATTRNNQVVALGQSIAGVESSVSTVATNLSAETNLRTLQYSQTTTSMAVIDTLSQTTATALSAETSTRQTQISSLNGNLSVVDLRSQTNVTNLQALSSTTNTLSTDFQGFKALATNDIQLLSTASSAQGSQLNLLAVTVGQNGAAITSLNTALVTESHSRVTGDSSLQVLYNGVSSTVSIQQTAIAGLEAQNNLARFDLTVAAGGGRPALFSMISTVAGSALALKGDQIWLGDHTYFDDVPAVFRTLTGGGRQRVWGGLFGSGGEMLDWLGPVTVPIGQMSRTNADFFLAASEPRIGGNSFPVSGSSGGYKALEAVMGLSGAYGLVASASLASAVSGSLMSMEVTGVGGTYGSPSASGMVMFKVTAQAATGGLEYPIGEASVTATSSGLSLPGGTFTVDWVGTAIGSLVVPLSGPVVIRLYARLYTGTAPTNATGSAVVTITPPAS